MMAGNFSIEQRKWIYYILYTVYLLLAHLVFIAYCHTYMNKRRMRAECNNKYLKYLSIRRP